MLNSPNRYPWRFITSLPFLDVWFIFNYSANENIFNSSANRVVIFFYSFQFNRNVLVVVSAVWECLTHIGLLKMRRTNTSRSFSSIRPTMPSAVTRKSTGSAKLSRNIVNCAVLHQPAKALVVLAKATDTPKPLVDRVVLAGAAEIVSTCTANVKLMRQVEKYDMFICIFLVLQFHIGAIEIYCWTIFLTTIKTENIKEILFTKIKICMDCVFADHGS